MTKPHKEPSEKEIAKRRDEVLKRMLNTPPKPFTPSSKGKSDKKPTGKRKSAK